MKCTLSNFDHLDIACQNLIWIGIDAVGIILLFITIILGFRATRAAVIAAETAQQSMIVGQRAYIGIFYQITSVMNEHDELVGMGSIVTVKNHGLTPAKNISVRRRVVAIKYRDDGSIYDVGAIYMSRSVFRDLQSNAEESVKNNESKLTFEELQILYDKGATNIIQSIKVEYCDVFDQKRIHTEQMIANFDILCAPDKWKDIGLGNGIKETFFEKPDRAKENLDFIWTAPEEAFDAGGIHPTIDD